MSEYGKGTSLQSYGDIPLLQTSASRKMYLFFLKDAEKNGKKVGN